MRNNFFYFVGLVLCLFCLSIVLTQDTSVKANPPFLKSPLSFEINKGQSDKHVKFLSRNKGHTLFLTPSEAVLSLKPVKNKRGDSVRIKLVGANQDPKLTGVSELVGKVNYFIGNDPKKWLTNISTYKKVKYEDIYSGVDLIYYGNQEKLEYDLVVAPNTDPRKITLKFEGAKKLKLNKDGNLILQTNRGEIIQQKPIIYQEVSGLKKEINGGYILKANNEIGIQVDKYDIKRPLVIDPELVYSTFLGGIKHDSGEAIVSDSLGNTYVTGATESADFPVTREFSFSSDIRSDAFVSKFNHVGTLIYSTFLGGAGFDEGAAIAVDNDGNAYVTGRTGSTDFPITSGVIQDRMNTASDVFITKLNSDGSTPIYSTYLGGSGDDRSKGIFIDTSGNAYICGNTNSSDFPRLNAFQTIYRGDTEAFISKINSTGRALVYSSYLGGSAYDGATSIRVDGSGNAYIGGITGSMNFPVTAGVVQNTLKGSKDLFISKVNPAGRTLLYSTYLGGNGEELGYSTDYVFDCNIAIDSSGNAYISAGTTSTDFPTTSGAVQTSNMGGLDAFFTKLDPRASSILYSTYLGGIHDEGANGITLDNSGNVYIAGATGSTNFPITQGALKTNPPDSFLVGRDIFISVFSSQDYSLLYSTYFGGVNSDEYASDITLDSLNNIYITGATRFFDSNTSNFPVLNPFQFSSGSVNFLDAFVTRISAVVDPTSIVITSPTPASSPFPTPPVRPSSTVSPSSKINKALKSLTNAAKKLARSSRVARPLRNRVISILREIRNALGRDNCVDLIESLLDDIILVLEEVRTKACESSGARSNVRARTTIRNCIPQEAINNFTEAVDKATDDISAVLEVDEDEDFTADVCQE